MTEKYVIIRWFPSWGWSECKRSLKKFKVFENVKKRIRQTQLANSTEQNTHVCEGKRKETFGGIFKNMNIWLWKCILPVFCVVFLPPNASTYPVYITRKLFLERKCELGTFFGVGVWMWVYVLVTRENVKKGIKL